MMMALLLAAALTSFDLPTEVDVIVGPSEKIRFQVERVVRQGQTGTFLDLKATAINLTESSWRYLAFELVLTDSEGKEYALDLYDRIESFQPGQTASLEALIANAPVPRPEEIASVEFRIRDGERGISRVTQASSGLVATSPDCIADFVALSNKRGVALRRATMEFVGVGCGEILESDYAIAKMSNDTKWPSLVRVELFSPENGSIRKSGWVLRSQVSKKTLIIWQPIQITNAP